MGDWYNDNDKGVDREIFDRDKIREFVRYGNPHYLIGEMLRQYGLRNMELILNESFSQSKIQLI